MVYYEDLTKYEYSAGEKHMLNIGWLSSEHPFTRGPVPESFALSLSILVREPCNLYRGFHVCEFCRPPNDIISIEPSYIGVWELYRSGNGEVRVTNENRVTFCAPQLIWHYIAEHQYQPPQEFIDAVLYHFKKNYKQKRSKSRF